MVKKILIIEDETNIRAMYADILRDEKFEVLEAGDGMRGLDMAVNGQWDVLLLDIMLPKMDGFELLRQLKSNPITKDRPVIILTNLADDNIKQTAIKLGAKDFLVKSNIMPSSLVGIIHQYDTADKG